MTAENNSTKFKVLIGILSALLIALAVYTVTLYNDSKNTVSGLEQQKSDIEGELEDLIANYDEVIQDNELKDKDLLAARERIELLLDSVKDAEANVALIKRYKVEIGRLKQERKILFRKADSLIAANKQLAMERDSTNVVLNETIRVVDSVSEQNIAMAETIKKGSVVNAVDLRGEAVIVRSSGKIVDTRRSSRADKVRACFTLTPNDIAESGDRLLYVQVINPKNNLLGKKSTMEFEDGILNYSEVTKVFYENEELDVCILVDAIEEDLIEGRYTINVFDGARQIATTAMELK
ncbi:MAG: hypothetical protein KJO05_01055 [Bacteroidia bacterium]|nr:hypothetical protein [Bacteroidia bacterium]NNF30406.1 hypothetical protein [Flavobacteriaceae bacterium]MBT8275700.1 hypothetical protein [Bacteroidia bacterium]NNJ82316.1 hypothetical protein [Flavobacteriaceae bacterium]NNK54713.1 hypothetical protein [Flavobacteriaceae bacterium]